MKLLISLGANLDPQNKRKTTPILIAAEKGFGEIVKALAEAGADVNLTRWDGQSALVMVSR